MQANQKGITTSVKAVWSCFGCMSSSRKMLGYRACGHKEDTLLEAPLF